MRRSSSTNTITDGESLASPAFDDSGRRPVLIILLSAALQGAALYALHRALKQHHWPATEPAWLLSLYALSIFVPTAAQLMAPDVPSARGGAILGGLAVAYFGFGWFLGANQPSADLNSGGLTLATPLVLLVLWLLVLPFLQSRASGGPWIPPYRRLFVTAWRNKLTLAEAGLFTALLWLLLSLWQTLFHALGIDYFRHLFAEPVFIYPATALAFGLALHLIGSLEHWTQVVLQQLLSVLKWLGLLAGIILALFTVTLVVKLPHLVFSGEKAIGAAWLLWLVAVVVLFVNAAYRDGSEAKPYPTLIGNALRLAIPTLVIVALTAVYALFIRSREYGLTVERFWAWVVAAAALIYAFGYAAAAFTRGGWMQGVGRVNLVAAFMLIAVLAAALTPLLSPYRLAADSQYREALRWHEDGKTPKAMRSNPLAYLRFNTGKYGLARLHQLADSKDPAIPVEIRQYAATTLGRSNPIEAVSAAELQSALSRVSLYPAGRTLDAALRKAIEADAGRGGVLGPANGPLFGVYVDLNGDGVEEFTLLGNGSVRVYGAGSGHWRALGNMLPVGGSARRDFDLAKELAHGDVGSVPRPWSDLRIGAQHYRFITDP